MARKVITIEEVNKELSELCKAVFMVEYTMMSKPCIVSINGELRKYAKASKFVTDIRHKHNRFKSSDRSDSYAVRNNDIEFYKNGWYDKSAIPELNIIVEKLGKNEFSLQELQKVFKGNTILGLSAIMDKFKREYKVNVNYKVINNKYTLYYKVA